MSTWLQRRTLPKLPDLKFPGANVAKSALQPWVNAMPRAVMAFQKKKADIANALNGVDEALKGLEQDRADLLKMKQTLLDGMKEAEAVERSLAAQESSLRNAVRAASNASNANKRRA
jgi:peptidoglycan hydrolase CwlO-like protein